MSCGVGHRRSLDRVLLWLWCRRGAAALIGPLAWEPTYATGVALKRQERKKGRKVGRQAGRQAGRHSPFQCYEGIFPCFLTIYAFF